MSEGLEIKLALLGGAEESVPVRFIQNGNGTASTAHTLVVGDLGDVEQYQGGGDVICSDVVWRRLSRKSCKTYWVRPAGGYPGMSSTS